MSAEFKPGDRVRILATASTEVNGYFKPGDVSVVCESPYCLDDKVCVEPGYFYRPKDLERVDDEKATFDDVVMDGYRTPYRNEIRVTNTKTGGEKGSKPQRFSLLPWDVLGKLAEHYAKGAAKYAAHNWRRGYDWSLSIDALGRHLAAFIEGETYDPETGSHHMLAVMFHAAALVYFTDEFPELDDRRKAPTQGEVPKRPSCGFIETPQGVFDTLINGADGNVADK